MRPQQTTNGLRRLTVGRALLGAAATTIALLAPPVTTVPATAATTGTTAVYTVPASIPADCTAASTTDGVTEQLNAWLSSIPSGTSDDRVQVDFGDGCFLLNDNKTGRLAVYEVDGVVIDSKQYWDVYGTATLRFDTPTPIYSGRGINRAELTLDTVSNLTLTGLTLHGPKPDSSGYDQHNEQDHNLLVKSGSAIAISNVTTGGAWGDNVAIKPEYATTPPADVSVTDSHMLGAGRHNVSVIAGTDITIDNNVFRDNHYWSVDAELSAPSWKIDNLTVTNNDAAGTTYGFIALTSRSDVTTGNGVFNVTISGNSQTGSANRTEFAAINKNTATALPMSNVKVNGNTFEVQQYGVSAYWVDGLEVQGNQATTTGSSASDCGGQQALLAAGNGVTSASVLNNTFLMAVGHQGTTVPFCQKTGTTIPTAPLTVSGNTTGTA